nr:tripartite tricarboxylate transporter substrate binding protein [Pseudomonas sp.]
LFAGTEAALTMNPHLYKSLTYNVETDFVPVSRLVALPLVFFVPKSSPANNLKEFIELAKQRGQSKPLTYGSSGTGGIAHLPMAMFAKQENLNLTHVPYKGAAPLIPDVIADRIDAAVLGVSVIEQHIKAGTLKALALSADQRSNILPDVPTFKEQGIKDINAIFNIGLLAPAGTPDSIVQKLANDAREVIMQPDFRAKNIDAYSYVAVASSPEEFKQFLADDLKVQGERVKVSGASMD